MEHFEIQAEEEIKPFMLITLDEFKNSIFYDELMSETTTYNDNYINEAIYITTTITDYFSGFALSEKIKNDKDFKYDNLKYGVIRHTQHLLRNGLEYMRGQQSFSLGSQSYSTSNPQDPLYITPELLIELNKLGFLQKQFIGNLSDKRVSDNYWNETYDGATKNITWREADATFTRYDGFKSSNKTLRMTKDTTNPYKPILDFEIIDIPLSIDKKQWLNIWKDLNNDESSLNPLILTLSQLVVNLQGQVEELKKVSLDWTYEFIDTNDLLKLYQNPANYYDVLLRINRYMIYVDDAAKTYCIYKIISTNSGKTKLYGNNTNNSLSSSTEGGDLIPLNRKTIQIPKWVKDQFDKIISEINGGN